MVAVALLGFSWLTWGASLKNRFKKAPSTHAEAMEEPVLKYDTAVLKKFNRLLLTLDFNRSAFEYSGRFNVRDGKDSTNNVRDLSFLFCRDGNTFYSKLGNTENINEHGVNIYIQPDMKKIVISNQEYRIKSAITDVAEMVEKARSENYELKTSGSGAVKTISLLNERHITCKELSATYDTLSNNLQKIQVRFTDISDPLNKKKDRAVEIDINKLEQKADKRDFPSVRDIVKEVNGKAVLRPKYAGYELIII